MKVGILGAGASGLTGIRICLEYGFEPICFEKTKYYGGLWRYKPDECEGEGSVMKSTVINTSKEMMAYSDFPPPKHFPNFMHNTRVVEYLQSYAATFDLLKYVRFETRVLAVQRTADYDSTGRWEIVYQNKDGEEMAETFDGVLLCSGHHVYPNAARFAGIDRFRGRVLHSHSYKDHVGYEDQTVVAVGVGNSGGDIAVELSRIAKQVYLVSRTGTWVFNRVGDYGYPLDAQFNRRSFNWLMETFPTASAKITEMRLNMRFDHANFGLRPDHGVFQAHLTVNDDLPNRILCGTVVVKPNIREVTETNVIFEDGSQAENVDTIILSTGYSFGFPYLESGVIPVEDNKVSLYKYVFPPNLQHSSLAVIGLIQPLGAIMPISEMQCRVFCEALSGATKLPNQEEMQQDVELKRDNLEKRYVRSRRHTIQVDYVPYMDELADLIGAKPNVASFLFKDPKLAYALALGPCAPYQYRIQGPHPWAGARDALLTIWDRIVYPTKPRSAKDVVECNKSSSKFYCLIFINALGFFVCLYLLLVLAEYRK